MRRSIWTFLMMFALLSIVLLLMRWLLGAGLIDDAYIYFRYADNFRDGHGLVFNPGERVEGYTSPLWVTGLSAVAMLGLELERTAQAVGLMLALSTVLLFACVGQRYLSDKWKLLIVLPTWFLITNPSVEYWASSGMDTPLFVFLFLLTFWTFSLESRGSGSMVWSGVCFLLAVLARLDALVLLPLYLLWLFLSSRRQPRVLLYKYGSFLTPQALLLLYFAWRYSYYGALLPNTYYAKADIPIEVLLEKGLQYTSSFATVYWPMLICALVALILIARSPGSYRTELGFALAIIFLWGGYVTYIGGDHFPMYRFYAPIIPFFALLFTAMLNSLFSRLTRRHWPLAGTLSLAAFVLPTMVNYHSYTFQFEGVRMQANIEFTANWAEVGRWLRKNADNDYTIASTVVGAIPYYSKLRTIDMLGLTDREVATKGKVLPEAETGHQKYNTDYVLSRRPDYIIYNSSGQYLEPIYRDPHKITTRYAYALYNLALDERTSTLYQYEAIRMENGRIIEFLRLKSSTR